MAAVQALLTELVDVNTPQPDGATALHWVANQDDTGLATLPSMSHTSFHS